MPISQAEIREFTPSDYFKKTQQQAKSAGGGGGSSGAPSIKSTSPKIISSQQKESMALGQGLHGPSKPSVKTSEKGTTITGGDSNSYSHDQLKSGGNNSFVSTSHSSKNEALGNNGMKLERSANSPLTINDSSEAHPNHHVANSTKGSPLTVNTGKADGDTYNIAARGGSITNINGTGKGSSTDAPKDTISYRPHLASPGDTAQINLNNFNPSQTDLKVDGKSLFGETDTNYSGSINFSRDNDSGKPKIEMDLQSTNE